MNGHLDCGCYDKSGNWHDIKYAQYVHIYGFQEDVNLNEIQSAAKQLDLRIDNTVITNNQSYGF